MSGKTRYASALPPVLAEGWSLTRLTPPSRLYGAAGLRTGADGRIYVAQVVGSQVTAVDPVTGVTDVLSPMGSSIVAPDDLAFDEHGNLFCTEITEGRVSMLSPGGAYRVIQGDMPVANPITYHQGRLIAGECNMNARIMELSRDGGAPRVILDNIPMVNAFEVGPDGKLYFPVMHANEIWRVSLDGGEPEVVARDLGVPDSVKFDARGHIVSTQVGTGQVLRIDPLTGAKAVLAQLAPGLDNCTFVGDRLFVSHMTGSIIEILDDGATRALIPGGLQWPMGLAWGGDGFLFVADGGVSYALRPGGPPETLGMLFSPGSPGFVRGVAVAEPGAWLVTNANGDVVHWSPARMERRVLATGYEELMGVAPAPGGAVVFAEHVSGQVLAVENGEVTELAGGLDRPMGLAISRDGTIFVAEAGKARVLAIAGGREQVVLEGLGKPEGIAIGGETLFVVDTAAKAVLACGLDGAGRTIVAANLPVGAPAGVLPRKLKAFKPLAGSMISMTGIATAPDGTVYVSADAEGSVLVLRRA